METNNDLIKEEKISSSVFFIKASSFEILSIWREYKDEVDFQEEHGGFTQQIGCIDDNEDKPINVSFCFAKIYNKRICFYETISRYNDNMMVEEWLKTNYPVKWSNGTRTAITDAMNFHNVIDHCEVNLDNDILAENKKLKKKINKLETQFKELQDEHNNK